MIAVLFVLLVALIALGFPVAIALGGAALMFVVVEGKLPLAVVAQRMVTGVDSFPLLALPFFVLSGIVMERAGITRRIMNLANEIVGNVRGGLAAVCVIASCFFGFISGSGVADTAAIGSILMPEMVRKGYGKAFTASLQASAGVLGIVIPPSLPIVIIGVSGGVSIGAMLLGGIIPGWLAGGMLIAVAVTISRRRGYRGVEVERSVGSVLRAVREAVLPLLTPVIILGGILGGIFTPTEAAAVAAVYAFVLGLLVYREIRLADLLPMLKQATLISAVIMFIIATAAPFAWIMALYQVPRALTGALLAMTQNPWMIMLLINLVLLILGMFMETTAIILICTPILMPLVKSMGFDPVHFGVIMTLNLAIGGVTPPLGVCLMTTCRMLQVQYPPPMRELLPFIAAMLVALLLTIAFPPLVTWLASMS